jgi:hypothetical protein
MMGIKLREFDPLPDLSLEEFVSKDNFYRRLEEKRDLAGCDLLHDERIKHPYARCLILQSHAHSLVTNARVPHPQSLRR